MYTGLQQRSEFKYPIEISITEAKRNLLTETSFFMYVTTTIRLMYLWVAQSLRKSLLSVRQSKIPLDNESLRPWRREIEILRMQHETLL